MGVSLIHLIMKILLDRVYFRADATVGFLKLLFSGLYESEYLRHLPLPLSRGDGTLPSAQLAEGPGVRALPLCSTLEPHAIPWQDNADIGQKAEQRIPGRTAIPEGTYSIELRYSKTHRRKMPYLQSVPEFRSVCFHTGKSASQSRGDILVGCLAPHKGEHPADRPELTDSRRLFGLLYAFIDEALDYGEPVTLQVCSSRDWTYPSASSDSTTASSSASSATADDHPP